MSSPGCSNSLEDPVRPSQAAHTAPVAIDAAATAGRAPGPRGSLLMGHFLEFERDALGFLDRCHRDHGDVVRFRFALTPSVLLAHPDHVRHVLQDRHTFYDKNTLDWKMLRPVLGQTLLTTDGEPWLSRRRMMQPAFHRERIAGFARLMVEQTESMLERWERAAREDEPVDVALEMNGVALDIITRALFGAVIERDAESISAAVTMVNRSFIEEAMTLPGLIATMLGRPTRSARRALVPLHELVNGFIRDRRSAADPGEDLLAMLLAVRDEETGEGLDDRTLRNELLTLFVAGHETTANALAWTFHLLSKHGDVRERLEAEVDSVLGGRAVTLEDLGELRYTRMVIDESMRLYPPAWATSRAALEDDEIGGFRVARGTLVMLSPWLTHRHPEFWPEPERFDPERFAAGAAERPRFAYYPFGGGPHLCIGNSFSLQEMMVVLATVTQRFAASAIDDRPVIPEPMITLRPRGGLPMRLHRRWLR